MKVSSIQTGYPSNNIGTKNADTISFGIANAGKLKTLFSYGLPCMYSGREMIDPKRVLRLLNTNKFNQPVNKVLEILKPFEAQIDKPELEIYEIIKEQAAIEPGLNLQQILESVAPEFQKKLRKEQEPVFNQLSNLAAELPENYQYVFRQLMIETDNKLNDKPVNIPFSSYEFKYNLEKIRNDLKKEKKYKHIRVINKMIRETERFTNTTCPETIQHQKKIVSYIEILLNKFNLKDNIQLRTLVNNAKNRLNGKRIQMTFSRKSFLYDLNNLLKGLPNKYLGQEFNAIAQKLPTSAESLSARVLKFKTDSPEKIAYRLLWPSFASVEHILPQSMGGKDEMANFGGATTRENTERGNISFMEQIKRRPKTPIFCQKYTDKLIDYVKNGIFSKHHIDTKYIDDYKQTLNIQSFGNIVINTSELETYRQKGNIIFQIIDSLKA